MFNASASATCPFDSLSRAPSASELKGLVMRDSNTDVVNEMAHEGLWEIGRIAMATILPSAGY